VAAKRKPSLKVRKKKAYIILSSQLLFLTLVLLFLPQGPVVNTKYNPEYEDYTASIEKESEPEPEGDTEVIPEEGKDPLAMIPHRGDLVILIDDVGHNMEQLLPFLDFPGPIAFAILPGLSHSEEAYQAIRAAGKTAILHQPMEALGGNDLGPGGIYITDTESRIRETLGVNLASFPEIEGLNNHMGSRASADPRVMRIVGQVLKEKGLYFIDSRTNSQSVISQVAAELKLPHGERDVFLDNEKTREYIMEALEDARQEAQQSGHAVMIGHAWTQGLADILMEVYPQLIEEGYSLVEIKDILMGRDVL